MAVGTSIREKSPTAILYRTEDEAKEYVKNFAGMCKFTEQYDLRGESFGQFWSFDSKRNKTYMNVDGGGLQLWNLSMQQKLGRWGTDVVRRAWHRELYGLLLWHNHGRLLNYVYILSMQS